MRFEVFDRKEGRKGLIFKKPTYIAKARIELTDDELPVLAEMAKTKQWQDSPLGEITLNNKGLTHVLSVSNLYKWPKGSGIFERSIEVDTPGERENRINEVRNVAESFKLLMETHLAMTNTSDEDVSIEI